MCYRTNKNCGVLLPLTNQFISLPAFFLCLLRTCVSVCVRLFSLQERWNHTLGCPATHGESWSAAPLSRPSTDSPAGCPHGFTAINNGAVNITPWIF